MGIRDSWTQFLFTLPSAVAVINGLLAGGDGGPGRGQLRQAAAAGDGAGRDRVRDAVLTLHVAYQVRHFSAMTATVTAAFPTPGRRPTLVP
jgi:hypothetical protein